MSVAKKIEKRERGAEAKTIVYITVERDLKQDPSTLDQYWRIGRDHMQATLDRSSYSLETVIKLSIKQAAGKLPIIGKFGFIFLSIEVQRTLFRLLDLKD